MQHTEPDPAVLAKLCKEGRAAVAAVGLVALASDTERRAAVLALLRLLAARRAGPRQTLSAPTVVGNRVLPDGMMIMMGRHRGGV